MKNFTGLAVKTSTEKVPIGTLLLAEETILPQDLEFALDHQRHSKQLIGEILITIGALQPDDLDKALKLQNSGRSY